MSFLSATIISYPSNETQFYVLHYQMKVITKLNV